MWVGLGGVGWGRMEWGGGGGIGGGVTLSRTGGSNHRLKRNKHTFRP